MEESRGGEVHARGGEIMQTSKCLTSVVISKQENPVGRLSRIKFTVSSMKNGDKSISNISW